MLFFQLKRKLKKQDFKDVNSHRITTTMLDYRFIEESIRWDKKLIHCVSSGSKVNSVKILDKIFDLYFIDEESYNIRKYQNKLIYYNTLLLDILIEKDFGNLYATGLFQRYMDKIEGVICVATVIRVLAISPPKSDDISALGAFRLPPAPCSFGADDGSEPLCDIRLDATFLSLSISSGLIEDSRSPILSIRIVLSVCFIPRLCRRAF